MKTLEERAKNIDTKKYESLAIKADSSYEFGYMVGATEQRAIDIESFKKWAIDNSYIPFDFYNDTKGIEEDRVIPFSDLMDYLKAMEE